MILPDTSAWIELDRASGSPTHLRLRELITEGLPLAVTEPVVMEVLAGARNNSKEQALERLLLSFELLRFDASIDFAGAARIYRKCRGVGVTPRGLIDCMIAAVARRNHATVLSNDRDLALVAKVIGLPLDPASLGA